MSHEINSHDSLSIPILDQSADQSLQLSIISSPVIQRHKSALKKSKMPLSSQGKSKIDIFSKNKIKEKDSNHMNSLLQDGLKLVNDLKKEQ